MRYNVVLITTTHGDILRVFETKRGIAMKPTIAIWGDSLLQGVVLDETQGRYSILENNCATTFAKKLGISITNNARFGCTAPKGRKSLARTLDSGARFGAAVLEYGGNDCDFIWDEVARVPEAEHQPKTPLQEFIACYTGMIEAVKAQGIMPILVSLPPLDAQRYFNWITRNGANRENILHWLGDVQHIYRWHERYSNAVATLARQYACAFVDIRDAFLSQRDFESFLCADGIHPNQKGHALMEQVFEDYALGMAL
jgi:lysophospholipase L1-like esterase